MSKRWKKHLRTGPGRIELSAVPYEVDDDTPLLDPSTAELLAEATVLSYIGKELCEGQARNLLSAALKCGCPHCLFSYFSMLDHLTQDERASDRIAGSYGIKRPGAKGVDYNSL